MEKELIKRQIEFSNILLDEIEFFARENSTNFNDAVRLLIQKGLGLIRDDEECDDDSDQECENGINNIEDIEKRIEVLEKNNGWFNADETQSKLSRVEFDLEELNKKVKLLTSLFRRHLQKNETHKN